jgi:hypothetical protein
MATAKQVAARKNFAKDATNKTGKVGKMAAARKRLPRRPKASDLGSFVLIRPSTAPLQIDKLYAATPGPEVINLSDRRPVNDRAGAASPELT